MDNNIQQPTGHVKPTIPMASTMDAMRSSVVLRLHYPLLDSRETKALSTAVALQDIERV